ncbi:30S ribosomal protein S20 [Candidatus Shapirobacteria bacterium]|nr:30S ribosomal protein S20 [Candidatus Shapirobacteria bacterium]
MPVTKSAQGALKQQQRRLRENKRIRRLYKESIKELKKNPNEKNLSKAFSQIDRAAKKNVIHKNKAARLKAQLSKLITKSETKTKSQEKKAFLLPKNLPTENLLK